MENTHFELSLIDLRTAEHSAAMKILEAAASRDDVTPDQVDFVMKNWHNACDVMYDELLAMVQSRQIVYPNSKNKSYDDINKILGGY